MKVTSFEPMIREDWIDGGRVLAVIDLMDDLTGLMLTDLLLTFDGNKPRVRPARRKGKLAQVYLVEGKPFHDRAAKAAKDHYERYTLEQLDELKDLWKGAGNNLAPVIAKVRRPRKAA
jgi:hypothetical protein